MTHVMLWLNGAFAALRYEIHQVIAQRDRQLGQVVSRADGVARDL
jgi:hypothetical protein